MKVKNTSKVGGVMKNELPEIISALELAILTAPNVPEATMSNSCIRIVLDKLKEVKEQYESN